VNELDFLEACYRPTREREAWARDLCAVAERLVPRQAAVGMVGSDVSPDARIVAPWTVNSDPAEELVARGWDHPAGWARTVNRDATGPAFVRAAFGAASPSVMLVSEFPPALRGFAHRLMPDSHQDTLALHAGLSSHQGLLLISVTPGTIRLQQRRRRWWDALAEHLGAAHALRTQVGELRTEAVLGTQGELLEGDAVTRDPEVRARLSEAVRSMDRARCRRTKVEPREALACWRAFVAGQYSLVEAFERGGRRVLLAVRVRADVRALTARERAVAIRAARAWSNKAIGASLGITTATVATHLQRVLRKLGCSHRSELVFTFPERHDVAHPPRTQSETRAHSAVSHDA